MAKLNLGKRENEFYKALVGVNPNLKIDILDLNDSKAMYLGVSETCNPVIEIGPDWYQFRGCDGEVLASSDRLKKPKQARKAAFDVKRAFQAVDPNLTQRIASQIQKSHPLLEALQSILPGEVEIIDGVPRYSSGGFQIRATSPKTLHISGNQLGKCGQEFCNLSAKNVPSKLADRLF